jgi:hypothetical protein
MSSYEFVGWLSLLLLFFGFEDIFERSTNIGEKKNTYTEEEKQQEVVMASSMLSSAAVVTSPAQATMVAPFTGWKSSAAFPVTRKTPTATTRVTAQTGQHSADGKYTCTQPLLFSEIIDREKQSTHTIDSISS